MQLFFRPIAGPRGLVHSMADAFLSSIKDINAFGVFVMKYINIVDCVIDCIIDSIVDGIIMYVNVCAFLDVKW